MPRDEVDFDRAWLRLKAFVASKRSHGQDALLAAMGRIEVECTELSDETTAREEPLSAEAGGDAPSDVMPLPAESTSAEGGNYDRRTRREPVHG